MNSIEDKYLRIIQYITTNSLWLHILLNMHYYIIANYPNYVAF